MNGHRRRAALFVMLALVGCAQGVTGLGQAAYAPYSQKAKSDMHDGGDGSI
jgi:hypothetical protein